MEPLKEIKKDRKKLAFSILSNLISMLTSLIMGLILPKFVSFETYADYKTFNLFISYLGFFHFGLINGIYLQYGEYDYESLPKERFRGYTRVLSVLQITVSVVAMSVLFAVRHGERIVSPYFFVIISIFFVNMNCYFTLITQFTKRFSLDAAIQLFQRILMIVCFFVLLSIRCDNYVYYVTAVLVINIIVNVMFVFLYNPICFGKAENESISFGEIKALVSRGFFVMISEYMGIWIVTLDCLIVKVFFDYTDFSLYSFAVSVVGVLYQFISIVSRFVFPYLKRVSQSDYPKYYNAIKTIVLLSSGVFLGGILLIKEILVVFLPKYSESIVIIQILALTLLFKTLQELVCGNYFKVLNAEKEFAFSNMIAVIIGVVTDILAYIMFRSMIALAIASVISFVAWFAISDIKLCKLMDISGKKTYMILLGICAVYLLGSVLFSWSGIIVYYSLMLIIIMLSLFLIRKNGL